MRGLLVVLILVTACDDDSSIEPTKQHRYFDSTISVEGDINLNEGSLRMNVTTGPESAPTIFWTGRNGGWTTGMDVVNNGGSKDFVVAAKYDWPNPQEINDVIYLSHNDDKAPTVGIGVTPPKNNHRLEVGAQDNEPSMGTMMLRRGPAQTGNVLTAVDSAGGQRWFLDSEFWLTGKHPVTESAVAIKADDQERTLAMAKSDATTVYGYQYAADASGSLSFRYLTGGTTNIEYRTNGSPHFPNGLSTSALRIESDTPPATSESPCSRGEMRFDSDHIYVCVGTNQWRRSALSDW